MKHRSFFPVGSTHLDHVGMIELLEELDLSNSGDVHAIFVGDDLDLLDGHSLARLDVAREEDGSIGTFADLLHLGVKVADRKILRRCGVHAAQRLRHFHRAFADRQNRCRSTGFAAAMKGTGKGEGGGGGYELGAQGKTAHMAFQNVELSARHSACWGKCRFRFPRSTR
ncbi:hypothetical protein L1887_50185 [Cichorium endivia]|nr:hypothetical protein L1887_50185 [Cichorium endivia]